MKPKVVFFGNSQGAFGNRHFRALSESHCRLLAVVDTPPALRASTNPRKGGEPEAFTEAARRRGADVLEPDDPNDPGFVDRMRDMRVDLFVAAGYVCILKPPLLRVPRIAAANFHASLLPAYRGKHPVFWALRHGERWSGLTVHVMAPGLDTGEILYQVRVRTRRRDCVADLYDRIMAKSVLLVPRLLRDTAGGNLRPRPQCQGGASYYSSVSERDFRLDWSAPAEQLRRWICTSPGKCFFDAAGRKVFVVDAEVQPGASAAPPGVVIRIGRANCTAATGEGLLFLRKARLSGGPAKSMARLCRELGVDQGRRLG